MIDVVPNDNNKQIYMRLIALWVICEALAGGILHSFKLPFTGLGVSSLSVICIILISYHVPVRGAVIRATIIVAIFKLMLSPQAAPTAYIALFFQGLTGQLLLKNRFFTITAVIFGMLALMETAIQRMLVLFLIYGNSFWNAVDEFMKKVISSNKINSFSLSLAVSYILIHLMVGFITGLYGIKLARKAKEWQSEGIFIFPVQKEEELVKKKRKPKLSLLLFVWLVLLLLYVQQFSPGGLFVLEAEGAARIFFRSVIIICTWLAVLSPILRFFIRTRLNKIKSKYALEITAVMSLLPQTLYIIKESWKRSSYEKQKLRMFFKYVIANTFRSA